MRIEQERLTESGLGTMTAFRECSVFAPDAALPYSIVQYSTSTDLAELRLFPDGSIICAGIPVSDQAVHSMRPLAEGR